MRVKRFHGCRSRELAHLMRGGQEARVIASAAWGCAGLRFSFRLPLPLAAAEGPFVVARAAERADDPREEDDARQPGQHIDGELDDGEVDKPPLAELQERRLDETLMWVR